MVNCLKQHVIFSILLSGILATLTACQKGSSGSNFPNGQSQSFVSDSHLDGSLGGGGLLGGPLSPLAGDYSSGDVVATSTTPTNLIASGGGSGGGIPGESGPEGGGVQNDGAEQVLVPSVIQFNSGNAKTLTASYVVNDMGDPGEVENILDVLRDPIPSSEQERIRELTRRFYGTSVAADSSGYTHCLFLEGASNLWSAVTYSEASECTLKNNISQNRVRFISNPNQLTAAEVLNPSYLGHTKKVGRILYRWKNSSGASPTSDARELMPALLEIDTNIPATQMSYSFIQCGRSALPQSTALIPVSRSTFHGALKTDKWETMRNFEVHYPRTTPIDTYDTFRGAAQLNLLRQPNGSYRIDDRGREIAGYGWIDRVPTANMNPTVPASVETNIQLGGHFIFTNDQMGSNDGSNVAVGLIKRLACSQSNNERATDCSRSLREGKDRFGEEFMTSSRFLQTNLHPLNRFTIDRLQFRNSLTQAVDGNLNHINAINDRMVSLLQASPQHPSRFSSVQTSRNDQDETAMWKSALSRDPIVGNNFAHAIQNRPRLVALSPYQSYCSQSYNDNKITIVEIELEGIDSESFNRCVPPTASLRDRLPCTFNANDYPQGLTSVIQLTSPTFVGSAD